MGRAVPGMAPRGARGIFTMPRAPRRRGPEPRVARGRRAARRDSAAWSSEISPSSSGSSVPAAPATSNGDAEQRDVDEVLVAVAQAEDRGRESPRLEAERDRVVGRRIGEKRHRRQLRIAAPRQARPPRRRGPSSRSCATSAATSAGGRGRLRRSQRDGVEEGGRRGDVLEARRRARAAGWRGRRDRPPRCAATAAR